MTRIAALRSLFGREDTVIYECRRCGHAVDADADECPSCNAADIAEYRL